MNHREIETKKGKNGRKNTTEKRGERVKNKHKCEPEDTKNWKRQNKAEETNDIQQKRNIKIQKKETKLKIPARF